MICSSGAAYCSGGNKKAFTEDVLITISCESTMIQTNSSITEAMEEADSTSSVALAELCGTYSFRKPFQNYSDK